VLLDVRAEENPEAQGRVKIDMKKILIAVAIGGLSFVALGKAVAHQGGNWQRQARMRFVTQHLVHDLNLTDEQRASIRAILQKEKPAIETIASAWMQENEQLRSKSTFDEAFVRSVAQQRSATMTEALVEKEKVRAEIFGVLTPAQQQKANQMTEEFRTAIQERLLNLGDQL
jgi:Spy/CpxP family protein refolding chaperone